MVYGFYNKVNVIDDTLEIVLISERVTN